MERGVEEREMKRGRKVSWSLQEGSEERRRRGKEGEIDGGKKEG